MSATPPTPPSFPANLLSTWLGQSHDLLALTDAAGVLRWANPAFVQATGAVEGLSIAALAPTELDAGHAHALLTAALAGEPLPDTEFALRGAADATLWVRARMTLLGEDRLWTLQDVTATHTLAAEAQRVSELLEMAQEFGRLGVWEREIPSGKGRWDRHVFRFWGLEADGDTPDHALAMSRIHPDDQNSHYLESTHRAGRYAQHYRVLRDDGSLRWIHSQWEVKNSPQGVPVRTIGIMMDDTIVHDLARSRDAAAAELRLVTHLADIGIWRHDFKTDRIHYNEHAFKVLGLPYRADGLSLEEARAPTHPEDVARLVASSAHARATGVPIDIEVRHQRSDGAWRWIMVRRVIERATGGEALGFVGVVLDVTARVEQSHRAEQLARRLETAAEAARIGIWSSVIGTRETEWNAQMYELFDMQDLTEAPTLGEWLRRCVHPDDMERVSAGTRAFMRQQVRAIEIEFRIRIRDGRTRWMVLRADLDRSGVELGRAFGIAIDVTERHEALAALHAASERAALIARHAGIGTWGTDADGTPTWDAQMWALRGLAPRAGAPTREERLALLHPDDREFVIDASTEQREDAGSTAYEFRIRLPDGRYRWLASRSAPLTDTDGRTQRRVGVNWDITESKNAEMARQQALLAERESQAKSRFLSRMSHELRTPLNAVLGFTQLLQLEARDDLEPRQRERLDHIRAAGEHLLALIDDALDLSSLQTGALQLDLRAVPLDALVAQTLPRIADLARSHEVTLAAGPLALTLRADAGRLRQVLQTLLDNAVRHNVPGGSVSLEARADGAQALLIVSDTGRGMNAAQLAQLFEPFSDRDPSAETGGSGIGLAIARALVVGMGGTLVARSQPGRGTTFEIRLPRLDEPPATSTEPRAGQLLYIEDNPVNVMLVEQLVRSLSGLQIASEATGAGGVARARVLRPDLILVDMQLPDFDGYEVLRRLRAAPETASIRCIALSANAMPEDIDRALLAGFDDYWTKPIKFKAFLLALERIFPNVPL